jgi:hypothetical protein
VDVVTVKKSFTYTVAFMHSSGKAVRYNEDTFLKCSVAAQEYYIAYCTYKDVVKEYKPFFCHTVRLRHAAEVRNLSTFMYYFRESQCCRFQELWVRGGTLM